MDSGITPLHFLERCLPADVEWHLLRCRDWLIPEPQPSPNAAKEGPFPPGGQPTFFRPTHQLPHVLATPPLCLAGLRDERDAAARTSEFTCPAPAPSVCETSGPPQKEAGAGAQSLAEGRGPGAREMQRSGEGRVRGGGRGEQEGQEGLGQRKRQTGTERNGTMRLRL